MQKIVAVLLVALLAAPAGAFAQDALINSDRDRDVGQTTSYDLSQDWLQNAVAREASQSADTLARAPLQQQSYQRSWARQHPALLGALVGAGIGVASGYIKCDLAHKNTDFPCKSIFGLQGAVFGGAVGFIVGLR